MRRIPQKKCKGQTCKGRPTVISVEENSKRFTVSVLNGERPSKVRIDAKPFADLLKCRCDYAIKVSEEEVFFFVELKGADVVKAAEQLAYTIENLNVYRHLLDYSPYKSRHACIVSSHGMKPAISTRYQVYKRRIENCKFQVKCKVRQLTAKVNAVGAVEYM